MSQTTAGVVIVGNGVAGTTAAFAIRDAGNMGPITLITEEAYPAYFRTRLPEVISGDIGIEKIIMTDLAKHTAKNIDLRLNTVVEGADVGNKTLFLRGGTRLPWDTLLLATGGRSCRLNLPGIEEVQNLFCLRTIADAEVINRFARDKKNAICIGGGLLGLEAAYHLTKLGLSVQVLETFDRLMPRQLDERGAVVLQKALERRGMSFLMGAKAARFLTEGGRTQIDVGEKGTLGADVFLMSAGVAPRREAADALGLDCGRGIKVDADGRTSLPGVFAAGDGIEYQGRMWGTWMAARHWGLRAAGGIVAGSSGKTQPFSDPPEVFRLKVSGIELLSVGETDLDGTKSAANSVQTHVLIDNSAEEAYRKIVVVEGRVRGAILVGVCPFSRAVERAVAENKNWKALADEMGIK
ncbi:MAG: FAD-dependent oxidoreductase [Candidatus Ozemobacteraceae bacterium]